MKRLRRAALVALAVAVGAVCLDGTAAGSTYAGQARLAGLTAAQADTLQQTMEGYLAVEGGTQLTFNQIDLDGAGRLVVALPGEKYARDPAGALTGQAPLAPPPCYDGDLCIYKGTNYTGDYRYYYACQTVPSPWATVGSLNDNQYSGTRSYFYYRTGIIRTVTAKYRAASWDWRAYVSIETC